MDKHPVKVLFDWKRINKVYFNKKDEELNYQAV
jgi:hypothetical protein